MIGIHGFGGNNPPPPDQLEPIWGKMKSYGLAYVTEKTKYGGQCGVVYHAPNTGKCGTMSSGYVTEIFGRSYADDYVRFGISLLYDYEAGHCSDYYHCNPTSGSILLWMVKIKASRFKSLIRSESWNPPGKHSHWKTRPKDVRVFPKC